jgi:hypothetical protein
LPRDRQEKTGVGVSDRDRHGPTKRRRKATSMIIAPGPAEPGPEEPRRQNEWTVTSACETEKRRKKTTRTD